MDSVADAMARLAALAASETVVTLSGAFRDAGYELALVGGPVRDAFLGRDLSDLDFTTNAHPDDILRVVTPISTTTWDIGRDFGTIGALVRNKQVEITTYRSDLYDGETRKPMVAFGTRIEDDLLRRDFTVNAMALGLPDCTLVDPSGGFVDLVARQLRTPSSPEQSFGDDPLRMMRAARFVSQLGFTLADDAVTAMTAMAESLLIISAERVHDEFVKLLGSDDPVPGIRTLVDTGLMDVFLPELPTLIREHDEHGRHKDVYEHSLTVLTKSIALEQSRNPGSPPDIIGRLAAILHDIGKPSTRSFDSDKAVTFYGHDAAGARLAKKRLVALRFDNDTVSRVCNLIRLHLRFFGYTEGLWTDSAIRRYVRDAGEELDRLHILVRSDVTTRSERKLALMDTAYSNLEARIEQIRGREELEAMRPDLDGDQIMRILDVPPGRIVGEARAFLMELRLDEGLLGEDEAEKRLRAWAAERELS
ncbi:MAG: CCA tRNA nucleotidyltransferase [Microbacteriaceae bacterium]|nr:CCA tRNA nucleotidyltransferase [Microbacteriaceae bacterium]